VVLCLLLQVTEVGLARLQQGEIILGKLFLVDLAVVILDLLGDHRLALALIGVSIDLIVQGWAFSKSLVLGNDAFGFDL
jgi:hypothetical protein